MTRALHLDPSRVREIAEPNTSQWLTRLGVDKLGLDDMDRSLLRCLIERFDGGPVGIESLAAAVAEEADTLEDVYEPYLIQEGFVMRTSRGRVATRRAYEHLGLRPRSVDARAGDLRTGSLFPDSESD